MEPDISTFLPTLRGSAPIPESSSLFQSATSSLECLGGSDPPFSSPMASLFLSSLSLNPPQSLNSSTSCICCSGSGRRPLLSETVGDLHGDLEQSRYALEMAGVLSSDGRDLWTRGETVLIQLGDILDRGEDEIAILSLLRSLEMQARAAGGAVFQRQKGVIARSILFKPGGPLACELARNAVVLKVNDWIFCHGGLLPHHVAYGIERMNWEVSQRMRGLSESPSESSLHIPFIATKGYDSVVWNRLYSRDNSDLADYQIEKIHSLLEETLEAVGAKAMVVGHTPQLIGVNCIWRVDVGMSRGVLYSRPEVLEIIDGKARVIRSNMDAYQTRRGCQLYITIMTLAAAAAGIEGLIDQLLEVGLLFSTNEFKRVVKS